MSLAFVGSDAALGRSSEESPAQPICLIVEDQALIGLAMEAYLEEMGLAVCEAFSSGAKALEWLAANTPTVAILDYALKDGPCTTLTSVLGQRGIPFVIYSGHERSIAPPELQAVPWINKPCDQEALLAALNRAAPALAAYQRDTTPRAVGTWAVFEQRRPRRSWPGSRMRWRSTRSAMTRSTQVSFAPVPGGSEPWGSPPQ